MHLSLVAHNILTVVSTTITILKYIKLELLVGFFVSPEFSQHPDEVDIITGTLQIRILRSER